MSNIIIRPATPADTPAVLHVIRDSIRDLEPRLTDEPPPSPEISPEEMAGWERLLPVLEFLAQQGHAWWVAEQAGQVVGHARSVLMGDVLELTEFFVHPSVQSGGIGRELLARVFPASGPNFTRRLIVATLDVRAQARYIKSGMTPSFPIYNVTSPPRVPTDVPPIVTDLVIARATDPDTSLSAVLAVDGAILGVPRAATHRWLMAQRDLYLYRRGGVVVGYGYCGRDTRAYDGPFALLAGSDFPAVLNHWERLVAGRGGAVGLEVPTIAREALHYLVARGFHIEQFITLLMTDAPIGDFTRYILTSPPFFI